MVLVGVEDRDPILPLPGEERSGVQSGPDRDTEPVGSLRLAVLIRPASLAVPIRPARLAVPIRPASLAVPIRPASLAG